MHCKIPARRAIQASRFRRLCVFRMECSPGSKAFQEKEKDDLGLDDVLIEEEFHTMKNRGYDFSIFRIINNLKTLNWSKVVWRNTILFVLLHIYSVYGLWLVFTSAMWKTVMFSLLVHFIGALGITMGAHRLWAHRTYKANFVLRAVLAFFQTVSFQNDIFEWSRDHRVHHKYTETDADPHNAQRGFFFSHMGWLMYKKHPDVISKGKKLDFSDLENDPIVRFQRKYYKSLVLLCCFVLPTVIPWYFWEESLMTSFMVPGLLRYCFTLHITWCVNSLAHWIGNKPYDKYIYPAQNKTVAFFALGEGWHNYHHAFPWDYKAAELGGFLNINSTTTLIDFCAKLGCVWDRKTASGEAIWHKVEKSGDGTHPLHVKLKSL